MAIQNESTNIVSDLSYHDYVMLLCFIDSEWTRKLNKNNSCFNYEHPFFDGEREFNIACDKYFHSLNDNRIQYNETNRKCKAPEAEPFKPFLYSPANFVPWGHADSLGVVLLDDLDPIHSITTNIRHSSIEDVCVAFCPKVESLSIDDPDNTFIDIDSILQRKETNNGKEIINNQFIQKHPLLAFTKFKMNGLLTVGHGLMFQQALYKSIAKKTLEIKQKLINMVSSGNIDSSLYNVDDIINTKVVFLDLQDYSEIATMILGSNYSVATAIIYEILNLTIEDIIDESITDILNIIPLHSSLIKIASKDFGKNVNWLDQLKTTHAFLWLKTTFAFSPHLFFEQEKSNCRGLVKFNTDYNISPGHFSEFENKIKNFSQNDLTSLYDKYYLLSGGTPDINNHIASGKSEIKDLVNTDWLIDYLKSNINEFSLPQEDNESFASGRVITNTSTCISVPTLLLDDLRKDKGKHFSLSAILRELQREFFYVEEEEHLNKQRIKQHPPRFALDKLAVYMRNIGIPNSLRCSISSLYKDFARIIADPFLFDSALDLYDVFATLHTIISNIAFSRETFKELKLEEIDEIVELVDSINNALKFRFKSLSPECEPPSFSCDFRGSLIQVALATDALIKCGLGLFKRYGLENDKCNVQIPKDEKHDRSWLGGVLKITSYPSLYCKKLSLGKLFNAHIAIFSTDVSHAFQVGNFSEHFHETFHIMFDILSNNCEEEFIPIFAAGEKVHERLQEIYSILLNVFVIFQKDTDEWLYHWITCYARDPISRGKNDTDTLHRLVEFIARTFMVIYPIGESKDSWSELPPEEYPVQNAKWIDMQNKYVEYIEKIKPFIPYEEMFKREDHLDKYMDYCLDKFKEIHDSVIIYMPKIWKLARNAYCSFVIKEFDLSHAKFLEQDVEKGMCTGRPFIRHCYHNPLYFNDQQNKKHQNAYEASGLDPLILISAMIKNYIVSQHNHWDINRDIYLYRSNKENLVDYSDTKNGWNKFQIDRNFIAKFSVDPEVRQDRLLRQIVFIKTCWDISSNLRGRRFLDILKATWPKLAANTN